MSSAGGVYDELLEKIQYLEKELRELKEEVMRTSKSISKEVAREEIEYQKNIIKNDLRDELRKELATKEDVLLAKMELKKDMAELKKDMTELDKKFTIYFIILLCAIILTSPQAIDLIKILLSIK